MKASIVIVAYGKRSVTETCLRSLEAALGDKLGVEWELVLVDNHSPDDTLELFRAWEDRATVVALPTNENFAGGCNAGAAAARGEVLVFLNNDTVVAPGALEALAEQVLQPGVAAAGPRLLYPGGTIQHAGVWMIEDRNGNQVPHHLFHHEDGELPAARIITDLDCVTGACLAVRAERFAALLGFETAYRNGWEDVDLCLRIRLAGDRIVYRGDVAIVHDEGATRGEHLGYDGNAEIFYRRWSALLEHDAPAVAHLWDAAFGGPEPHPSTAPADVFVAGQVSGVGPRGAQVRALVTGLEAIGLAPAARDAAPAIVCPRLSAAEWAPVQRALGRPASEVTPRIEPEHVPAPIVPTLFGPGGQGTLVLLPAHDLDAAARLLDAAVGLGAPVRACPTARSTSIEQLVAERAPAVELLDACGSEPALAAHASVADVVVAADPADPWDRAALVCAGAGAAVVVREQGAAAAILGDLAGLLGGDPPASARREERRATVQRACAPERVLAPLVAALADAA